MIEALSNNIARYIGGCLNSSTDEIEVYAYGMQIITGAMLKLLAIILLAWLIDTLVPTVFLFVTFAAFRCFGGGAHLNSYARCLIFGITVIVGLGAFSQVKISNTAIFVLFAISFFAAIYIGLRWVPGDTEKKQLLIKIPAGDRK